MFGSWCLYEFAYIIAVSSTFVLFYPYALYLVIRGRKEKFKKTVALHTVSLFSVGLGYLISEMYIDAFANHHCDASATIAINSMIIALFGTIMFGLYRMKQQYLFGLFIDKILIGLACIILLLSVVFSFSSDEGIEGFFMLIMIAPIEFLEALSR
jgi:hypothetical protein